MEYHVVVPRDPEVKARCCLSCMSGGPTGPGGGGAGIGDVVELAIGPGLVGPPEAEGTLEADVSDER